MKKIVSLFVLAGLTATAAQAAPSYLTRDTKGGYNVTYDYNDKAKTGWYVGGRAELSLLNWTNEYNSEAPTVNDEFKEEDYSLEPVFGGAMFGGFKFNYFWRAELEAGLIGQYSDKDDGFEFKMTVPYVTANIYRDFVNGLYVGAGLGVAVPKTELDFAGFESGDRTERDVSLMGALMLGYTYELDYNLVLDLRYRLAGFNGTKQTRVFNEAAPALYGYDLEVDTGLILDNSFSIGIRYEF